MLASELREACEAVLNASPMDYEAACEVWTRVCTPQAVLAALDAAAANEAALRVVAHNVCEVWRTVGPTDYAFVEAITDLRAALDGGKEGA